MSNRTHPLRTLAAMVAILGTTASLTPADSFVYDFGTGTGVFNDGSDPIQGNTLFFPAAPSGGGTAMASLTAVQGGMMELLNPGEASLGSDTELRIKLADAGNAKFSIVDFPATSTYYMKFDLWMEAANPPSSVAYLIVSMGDGARFETDQGLTYAENHSGFRFIYYADGTSAAQFVTNAYKAYNPWKNTADPVVIVRDAVMAVEIYANAGTGTETYWRDGVEYTLAANGADYWIADTVAQSTGNPDYVGQVDSLMIYGGTSRGGDVYARIDNLEYGTTLPIQPSSVADWLVLD